MSRRLLVVEALGNCRDAAEVVHFEAQLWSLGMKLRVMLTADETLRERGLHRIS